MINNACWLHAFHKTFALFTFVLQHKDGIKTSTELTTRMKNGANKSKEMEELFQSIIHSVHSTNLFSPS